MQTLTSKLYMNCLFDLCTRLIRVWFVCFASAAISPIQTSWVWTAWSQGWWTGPGQYLGQWLNQQDWAAHARAATVSCGEGLTPTQIVKLADFHSLSSCLCVATSSYQWYSWGPTNMQCRLCASCWTYWKKYGGLKMPTRLDGERPGPNRNNMVGVTFSSSKLF